MLAILAVTAPFFALILVGWLAARHGLLPVAAVPGLNSFVLYFALPCMLLRFGMNTPVLDLLNPVILLVYLLAALLIVFFTVSFSWTATLNLKDAAFGALVAAFPNSGFIGVPLLVALLGPAAAGPVICTILADMMITSSVCLGLAQAQESGGRGPRAAGLSALRGALSNPLPWSIAIGAVIGGLGWHLPGPLDSVVRMLADAASPVALFTIGAVLWRTTPHAPPEAVSTLAQVRGLPYAWLRARHVAAPFAPTLPVALVKLLLHPLLVLSLGSAARALGAPLSPFALTVLTLTAALPSASNVSLLAERYGADNGRVARIILLSTLLAFASFSLLAWAFIPAPSA